MPTMLVSSTCHDLSDLRDFLDYALPRHGFQTVLSDRGTLAANHTKHSYDNCIDAARSCDITVGVIGGRFGGPYKDTGKSITQVEIETALDAGKQVQVFVRRSVLDAKEVLKPYRKAGSGQPFLASKIVEDARVFDVIDALTRRNTGNWLHPFQFPREILFILSKQLGFTLSPYGLDSLDGVTRPRCPIDVEVLSPTRNVRLSHEGGGPLRRGEFVRLLVSVPVASYLYLIWLGSNGEAIPVYPWIDFGWGTRPDAEDPRSELSLPPAEDEGWELNDDPPGMEAVILLARPTPMTIAEEEAMREKLATAPAVRPSHDETEVVWFDGEREVLRGRKRGLLPGPKPVDLPLARLRQLLRSLAPALAPTVHTVCFTRC